MRDGDAALCRAAVPPRLHSRGGAGYNMAAIQRTISRKGPLPDGEAGLLDNRQGCMEDTSLGGQAVVL